MLAVHGYYDGVAFQPLEQVTLRKNQQVIITILDNVEKKPKMSEEERLKKIEEMCGCLHEYAIKDGRSIEEIMELESKAWEQAVVEKYGNV